MKLIHINKFIYIALFSGVILANSHAMDSTSTVEQNPMQSKKFPQEQAELEAKKAQVFLDTYMLGYNVTLNKFVSIEKGASRELYELLATNNHNSSDLETHRLKISPSDYIQIEERIDSSSNLLTRFLTIKTEDHPAGFTFPFPCS